MFICARGHAHSRSAWTENIADVWLTYTNIWETLQSVTTLMEWCESKFRLHHFCMLIKVPFIKIMASNAPQSSNSYFSSRSRQTKQEKKKLSGYHHVVPAELHSIYPQALFPA